MIISLISLPRLCSQMQISLLLVHMIQASLHWGNISYSIILVSPVQPKKKIIKTHCWIILKKQDRGIIYYMTITLIKKLSILLDIPYYTSTLNNQLDKDVNEQEKKRKRRFQVWCNSNTHSQRWMIVTSCFSEGINFPEVYHIIHVEVNNMLHFLQKTRCLGWDDLPSSSILIYSKLLLYYDPEYNEHVDVLPMREFMKVNILFFTILTLMLTCMHWNPILCYVTTMSIWKSRRSVIICTMLHYRTVISPKVSPDKHFNYPRTNLYLHHSPLV